MNSTVIKLYYNITELSVDSSLLCNIFHLEFVYQKC